MAELILNKCKQKSTSSWNKRSSYNFNRSPALSMYVENHHINIECASVICKQLFSHTYSCSHNDNQWFVDDKGWIYHHFIFVLFLYFSNHSSCRTDQFPVSSLKFGTQDFTDLGLLKIRRTLTGLSLWVLPAFTSVGEYTKTKVSDQINAFLAILWRKCLNGKFWQELKQICCFFCKTIYFFGLWLWVAIKTATTISRRKRSFQGIKVSWTGTGSPLYISSNENFNSA